MGRWRKILAGFQPHQAAWLRAHPERSPAWLRKRLRDGFDVHHVDGNHDNNAASNLVLMEHRDHFMIHSGSRPRLVRGRPLRQAVRARTARSEEERIAFRLDLCFEYYEALLAGDCPVETEARLGKAASNRHPTAVRAAARRAFERAEEYASAFGAPSLDDLYREWDRTKRPLLVDLTLCPSHRRRAA